MKYTKPHLSFEKQADLLASRGLIIGNRSLSVQTLSQISYYRLSAYCIPFQDQKDHFAKGVKFEDILQLYNFDHELRVIVFNSLEFIEIALRTMMTYYLSKAYGPFGYANPNNFSSFFSHSDWFANVEDEISRSRENFITHYRTKYSKSKYFPIWMATEVFSFGSLSKLYRGLKKQG